MAPLSTDQSLNDSLAHSGEQAVLRIALGLGSFLKLVFMLESWLSLQLTSKNYVHNFPGFVFHWRFP